MLPKSRRLNLKTEFKSVSSGKRIETPSLTLFIKEDNIGHPLVGIATRKKSFKKAHERNAAKRVVATSFQELYENLKPDLKIMVMPKDVVLTLSPQQVLNELREVKELYR
ncbi:MAG: hypothetical protein US86_C0002G0029 [Candidatus Daviesbacteria bacterium GW2011_GWA2_38_24]|uniref:Ribonuclease P protein component n=1 Tax=Candidatus Daviesbacteria bacterium GW2011_GWA2_38_24 TaxID=1618422 RepID=A0A0G0JJ88_9BACT|nr:MAG: hypothetical protein US86_C0002G0029 [Candidatus Daviesbacteria bacterium GW2011_GWA2_38_24]KKQ79775.1 MAG: hypothetical protein UT01_C0028G0008 [Candidatus Daviesbacteria bacterium GW2011_GWA1_38_7]OGE24050.1 MAG: ribonuclease P protein component [Candidatus Daviesbacteria bacterium RIFCSPHIGHO2_01_FULL_38_8]